MDKNKLYKYLKGEASEEELVEIGRWIDESDKNREYLAELKAMWVVSTMPENKADASTFLLPETKKYASVTLRMFYSAAAVLFILLALNAALLIYTPDKEENRIAITTLPQKEISNIYTEKGTKAVVSLPDGSKVWLNSDSKLIYPTNFPGDTREVNLSGEAYFEVVSDSLKPMMVTTPKGYVVKVLGTKFHIKSYENDSYSKVTLNSGNIRLICPSASDGKAVEEIVVAPNETIILGEVKRPQIVNQSVRSIANDVAWKNGELVFDRTPMDEAIKMIERWHGAKFTIKNKTLLSHKFTATFKTESLVQILEVIKMLTGIEYTLNDDNTVILR